MRKISLSILLLLVLTACGQPTTNNTLPAKEDAFGAGDTKAVVYDTVKEKADLEKDYADILDYADVKRCSAKDKDDSTVCVASEDAVAYLYKTKNKAPNSVVAKNAEKINDKTYKIYNNDAYFQEYDKSWVYTEFKTIKKADFEAAKTEKADEVNPVSRFNPFHIYSVLAAFPQSAYECVTDTYENRNSTFATALNGAATSGRTGRALEGTAYYCGRTQNNSGWWFGQSWMAFDTSGLDGTVSSSSLFLYTTNASSNNPAYSRLYGQNSADDSCLYSDYKNFGTTLLAPEVDFYTTSDGYKRFELNADGRNYIDVDGGTNFAFVSKNYQTQTQTIAACIAVNSTYTGTARDPYLLVDLTAASTARTDGFKSSTIFID